MDDLIPVDPETRMPPWGLTEMEPWKIILMKAWLKEKKTISALMESPPYEFIEAFGFPGYRALAVQKEMNNLSVSHLKAETKAIREKRIPLDIPGYIVVGKTRASKQVEDLGLVPNRAGYRICKTRFQNKSMIQSDIRGSRLGATNNSEGKGEDNIYKIHSSLPSHWVGEYSIFSNGKIHSTECQDIPQDINNVENEFMASYFEISRVFSKFYICPEYDSNKFDGRILEDSLAMMVEPNDQLFYFVELKVASDGFLNLNIELPVDSC